MCKANGLEIVGSAKFHPNHLPQNTTKNKDKDTKTTKIAATDGKEQEVSCADVTSDDNYENSKN